MMYPDYYLVDNEKNKKFYEKFWETKLDPNNVDFDGYKHIFSGHSKFSGPNGMEFKLISETES